MSTREVSTWYLLQCSTALNERVNFGVVVCGPSDVLISVDTRRLALLDPNAAEAARGFAEDVCTMSHRLSSVAQFRAWIDDWRTRLTGVCQITQGHGCLQPANEAFIRIRRAASCWPPEEER